jgi:3,4-dihydroxy-9,10-secoandrosta-1,3,5(10)-triene-9,17-dione 4,5-dioxygenase
MGVNQLGYLVLDVSNLEAWRDLAASVIGAEERRDEGSGQVRLRLDEHHHRITLRPAKTDAVVAIGWEAPSLRELESVRSKVAEHGLPITEGRREILADRKVEALFGFTDMDGVPLEIYYGPWMDDVPFRPSRPMSGFNCGPLGVGHAVLVSKDAGKAARFYQDALGFSVTDYIARDELDATFLHCNPRHHSLALMNECYGMKSGELNHIMLETRSLEDVGRAYDIVRGRKLPLVLSLGQHSNDRMTSFYMKTPSGFSLEYGWGGLLVDDAVWRVKHHSTTKLWGHDYMGEASQ